MRRLAAVTFVALGLTAGAAGGYWYALPTPAVVTTAADRMVLYYRDPSGAPYWSATPKKDKQGRDYGLFLRTRSRPSDRAERSRRLHE